MFHLGKCRPVAGTGQVWVQFLSPAPQAEPHAEPVFLSPAPHAEPHAGLAFLSPAPQAEPQAAAAFLSPAPHADPQADAGLSFVFLPNRFLSDILSLLRGIVRVVLGGNACEKVIIAVLFNSRTNLFVRIDSYLFRQQENP